MPDQNPTHTGASLRARRKELGLTVADAAERLRAAARPDTRRRMPSLRDIERSIRGHEAGDHTPCPRYRLLYASAYDTSEDTLFPAPNDDPRVTGTPRGTKKETVLADDWDEMERRRLILAALGMGAGTLTTSGESLRQLLDLTLDTETRSIEDWTQTCVDQLHALRTRPPALVRENLSVDLLAVHRQLRTANAKDVPELQRVLAALSTLQANVLTRLADHEAAIRWWRTARTAADASGNPDVLLMVRCEEAGFGLYGQRDLSTVLRLVETTQGIAGDRPSFWQADLAGIKAKALSLLGRHDEAKQSLRTFVEWDGGDARAKVFPTLWTFDQRHFAESWVYAREGNETEADKARDLVLKRSRPGDYVYKANVQLHGAMCTVVKGGIDQGAQQAATVLDAIPPSYRAQLITEMGKNVLHAVPVDQRQRPAVREYREVLSFTAPTQRALPSAT